jgi:hypothetical protein
MELLLCKGSVGLPAGCQQPALLGVHSDSLNVTTRATREPKD